MRKQLGTHSAAVKRLPSSVLGRHVGEFCRSLEESGYTTATIRQKSGDLRRLARWMEARKLDVRDLDERSAKAFITARSRRGLRCGGVPETVRQLIEYLRSRGAVARPLAVSDNSVGAATLGRYEAYLRAERGLSSETISGYLFLVRPFVVEALAEGEGALASLSLVKIRGYLLKRARCVVPQRTQAVAKALRSFLRFLFLRGHTPADLSRGVPTVRQERIVLVPRHVSPFGAAPTTRAPRFRPPT